MFALWNLKLYHYCYKNDPKHFKFPKTLANFITFLSKIPKFSLEEMFTKMKIIASGIRINALFKQLMSVLTRTVIQQEKETNTVCIEIVSSL